MELAGFSCTTTVMPFASVKRVMCRSAAAGFDGAGIGITRASRPDFSTRAAASRTGGEGAGSARLGTK